MGHNGKFFIVKYFSTLSNLSSLSISVIEYGVQYHVRVSNIYKLPPQVNTMIL